MDNTGDSPLSTFRLVQSDLQAMIFDRGFGPVRRTATAVLKVLLYPRIRAVIYYRIAHWAMKRRLAPLAFVLQQMGLKSAGAEIHPNAYIGSHFCLFHSSGLVIGDQVVIGRNFRCFHGVTIGDANQIPGQPNIGNDVTIYAGAKLIGPIHIGDRSVIGANAVVLIDVPADSLAVGVPAKVVKKS